MLARRTVEEHASWLELDLEVPPEDEDRAAAALWVCGSAGSWTVRPGLVRAYFGEDSGDIEARFREAWAETTGESWRGALRVRSTPDRDWLELWRAAVQPVVVSPTLRVVPPGARFQGARDPRVRVVVIQPGQGFGTGSHPTTRALLGWIEADPGERVLDVGCGSGVLAIAALELGAALAVGLDPDRDAIANAAENRSWNPAAAGLHLIQGTLDAIGPAARFDRVLANLDRRAFESLSRALVDRCEPGGRVGVAGLLASERGEFLDSLRGRPVDVLEERADEDAAAGEPWWSAWLARRKGS